MKELQEKIGYFFSDQGLLETALTHSSYSNAYGFDQYPSNERIEYLGDAVLELVVSEYIYRNLSHLSEGDMTKLRSVLVCEENLALKAKDLSLGSLLKLDKGASSTGEEKRASLLSDTFEALIGAVYLDGGLEEARGLILRFLKDDFQKPINFNTFSPKTILQERFLGESKQTVSYRIIKESGPPHNKTYEVEVCFGNQILARGIGSRKKDAEQDAAKKALIKLEHENESRGE